MSYKLSVLISGKVSVEQYTLMVLTALTQHYCQLDLATSMGVLIMVIIQFIYPLSSLWSARGKQQWQNCLSPSRVACDEAHSGSVLQGKGS